MNENDSRAKVKRVLYLPDPMAGWFSARPWLEVRRGAPSRLEVGKSVVELAVYEFQPPSQDEQLLLFLPSLQASAGDRQLVIASGYLRRSLRRLLEERSTGYLDARGHLHLSWDEGVLHIEQPACSADVRPLRRGLGVGGVRAIQAILSERGPILLSRLAERVQLSLSQTHAVLELLETEGLVRSSGTGPAKRRELTEPTRLLEWLVGQPSARRKTSMLEAALYARTPQDCWNRISGGLGDAGISYAITGPAGAAVHGAGPTSVMVTTVRIDPRVPLLDAARAFGADPVGRGANIRLLRDTGFVGCIGTERIGGLLLAPRPRIYLDTLSDRRGEDIAQHFREVILGY